MGVFGGSHLERDRGPPAKLYVDVDVFNSRHCELATYRYIYDRLSSLTILNIESHLTAKLNPYLFSGHTVFLHQFSETIQH